MAWPCFPSFNHHNKTNTSEEPTPPLEFTTRLGHIERRYIEVPIGAAWFEATMNTSGFDTPREFYVHAVQISPFQRPMKWEFVRTYSSPSSKSFAFPVEGGLTLELVIAQLWSSGIGSHKPALVDFEIGFHGIRTNTEHVLLEGSDAPVRIDAEALLSTEHLVPYAKLNKAQKLYCPIDAKLITLSSDRDKLPSGKLTLALILTYKFELKDGSNIRPMIPLLNNRVHDSKFESQFYMISDSNKRVHTRGDAYPEYAYLPKGEYNLQLYLRHDNVQILDKLRGLVLFIERKLESQEAIALSFYVQSDGPIMGNGSFKQSTLIPGVRESFYVSPPAKDTLPKNCMEGTVLTGTISYGRAFWDFGSGTSYPVSYLVPPSKHDEDEVEGSSANSTKTVSERLDEEVRDAKINVFASLSRETDEERSDWIKLSKSLKSEYPKYTPLLSKVLEGVHSTNNVQDKTRHYDEIIDAANDVIESIDKEEQILKAKMEATSYHLTEALYHKGLALAKKDTLKRKKDVEGKDGQVIWDLFEENLKELKKWVELKSSDYSRLLVIHEKHNGRLGTALKVLNEKIQWDGELAEKKLYKLRISLLEELGWKHLAEYEKQWLLVRFPPSLPLF